MGDGADDGAGDGETRPPLGASAASEAAGERARRASVGRMQVHADAPLLNLRDLPSIIPNHPTHAQH